MRLSTRIAIAVAAVVPLLVLASGLLLLRLVSDDLRAQADAHLRERAASVTPDARNLLRATAADRPASVAQARERKLFTSALDVGIRLTGPDGTVMDGPQPDASVPLPPRTGHPYAVSDKGRGWRVLAVPVSGTRAGVHGTLWLFSPDTTSRTQIQLVRRRVFTVALLAAPLAGAVAWGVAAGAARPLRRLQQRTSGLDPRVSAARLDHTPTRIAEVDDLARTLQTVLARYDEQASRTAEALATARSFSAAASHELRTPLMSMQTNLEILGGHPDLAPADRAEVVEDLRREHTRLLGLLVMLRALAQGDLVEADAFGPVDLAQLLDAAVSDLRRGHPPAEMTVHSTSGLLVHGWEPGLRSAVDNLLVNALNHGRDGDGRARIAVTLHPGGGQDGPAAVLTVEDQGPGVPADRREAVFQRFNRRADSPGSGLGLTLVAQQIALHRGRIRILDGAGGRGARFEVTLPVTGPGDREMTLPLRRDWLTVASARPQGFHKEGS